jgi:hypothetical protein
MIGATQENQSWATYSPPANCVGPVLRARSTEVLVSGIVGIEVLEVELSLSDPGALARPFCAFVSSTHGDRSELAEHFG